MTGGFFKDVLEGRVRDVKKWLEEGQQQVGAYDSYGNTALHLGRMTAKLYKRKSFLRVVNHTKFNTRAK